MPTISIWWLVGGRFFLQKGTTGTMASQAEIGDTSGLLLLLVKSQTFYTRKTLKIIHKFHIFTFSPDHTGGPSWLGRHLENSCMHLL